MSAPGQSSSTSLRRTAIGLLALAALWNALYWLWPVHREAPVVMAGVSADTQVQPAEKEQASEPEPAPPEPMTRSMGLPADQPPTEPTILDPMVHDPEFRTFIVQPQFDAYTVTRDDEDLGDIAEKFYGDRALDSVIARANPMRDPRRISIGQVWYVPKDPANIQGLTVDAEGNLIDAPIPRPPAVSYTEYTVQSGDTLGAISKLHYKTTRYADAIFAFNRERLGLDSPRGIRPGQVLRIPSEPR